MPNQVCCTCTTDQIPPRLARTRIKGDCVSDGHAVRRARAPEANERRRIGRQIGKATFIEWSDTCRCLCSWSRAMITLESPTRTERRTFANTRVYSAALLTLGAGLIHLAVGPAHLREFVPVGLFLVAVGSAQMVLAV